MYPKLLPMQVVSEVLHKECNNSKQIFLGSGSKILLLRPVQCLAGISDYAFYPMLHLGHNF